jgi:hypothetical protein
MSLLKLVQKDALKLVQKDAEGLAAEAPEIDRKKELAETGGIVFSDGRAFELIKDRAGQMLLLD